MIVNSQGAVTTGAVRRGEVSPSLSATLTRDGLIETTRHLVPAPAGPPLENIDQRLFIQAVLTRKRPLFSAKSVRLPKRRPAEAEGYKRLIKSCGLFCRAIIFQNGP